MGNSHSNNEECFIVINNNRYNIPIRKNKNSGYNKFTYFDIPSSVIKKMKNEIISQVIYYNKLANININYGIKPTDFYRKDIEIFNHKIEKDEYSDIIEHFNEERLTLKIRSYRHLYNPVTIVIDKEF